MQVHENHYIKRAGVAGIRARADGGAVLWHSYEVEFQNTFSAVGGIDKMDVITGVAEFFEKYLQHFLWLLHVF